MARCARRAPRAGICSRPRSFGLAPESLVTTETPDPVVEPGQIVVDVSDVEDGSIPSPVLAAPCAASRYLCTYPAKVLIETIRINKNEYALLKVYR